MSGRVIGLACLGLLAALVAVWLAGGFDAVARFAAAEQREFQNTLARVLRELRAGTAGALAGLLAVSFAYGFFHAVGPGHGKVLVGGYGLARDVPVVRLAALAALSSAGQAVTAIALVYGGLGLFQLTRERMVGIAEDALAPLSYAAIAAIGAWLAFRGARLIWRARPHQDHHHHGTCDSCGHSHGPSVEDIRATKGWRDMAILVAGIAMRPCTGAVFVLLITWQMGIAGAGIAAAFAMASGTALVTVLVALAAAGLRGGMLTGLAGSEKARRAGALIEISAGLAIGTLALAMLL